MNRECIVCGKPATTAALYDPLCAECAEVERRLTRPAVEINMRACYLFYGAGVLGVVAAICWLRGNL